jgi:hypothetical protein
MINEINELGDISSAEKALILSSLTKEAIDLQSLENFLSEEELAWRDEITGNWTGLLPSIIVSGGEIGEGLAELFRHLNKIRSVHIETDKPEWAVKCSSVLAGLVALGHISQEQSDAVIALGGGLKNDPVSAADIDALVAEHEAEALAEQERVNILNAHMAVHDKWIEKYNFHLAPLMASLESDEQVWADAIQELLDGWVE